MVRKIVFKYWKIYLIFLFSVFVLYFAKIYVEQKNYNENKKDTVLLFTVNDVSKKCYSNSLKVYSNGKYEIVGINYDGDEPNIIKINLYNYDINKVINALDNKTCDNDSHLNYKVVVDEDETYCIGINSNHELTKFISSLNEEKLFWCE